MPAPTKEQILRETEKQIDAVQRNGRSGYAQWLAGQQARDAAEKLAEAARFAAATPREKEIVDELASYDELDPYREDRIFGERRAALLIERNALVHAREMRARTAAKVAADKAHDDRWLPLPSDFVGPDDPMRVAHYSPHAPSAQLVGPDGRGVAFAAVGPRVAVAWVPAEHLPWLADAIALQRETLGEEPTVSHVRMLVGEDRWDPLVVLRAAGIEIPNASGNNQGAALRAATSWFWSAFRSTRALVRLARVGPGTSMLDAEIKGIVRAAAHQVAENVAGVHSIAAAEAWWREHDRAAASVPNALVSLNGTETDNSESETA